MKEVALTQDQEKAKEYMMDWYFNRASQTFTLAGYAGTGKTFLINHVVKECFRLIPEESVFFVTPTGKAATVLIQSGTPAGTIHSLIYRKEEIKEEFVDEDGVVTVKERLIFKKRSSISDEIKLIVVDESSMVSDDTVQDLLSFNVKCLFSGDSAQLPPVSGRNSLIPDYELTEIVRQEAENPIVQVASLAWEGKLIPYGVYGENVCVIPKWRFKGKDRARLLREADQVICGTNATRARLNGEIRSLNGFEGKYPENGEKLICTLNNWDRTIDYADKFHLVNGIIGYVEDVELSPNDLALCSFRAEFLPDAIMSVPFDAGIFASGSFRYGFGKDRMVCVLTDGRVVSQEEGKRSEEFVESVEPANRFEFGYAITCHKAQGSEFDFVVVFDESRFFEEGNKWLYTAVTRAKKKLLIVR